MKNQDFGLDTDKPAFVTDKKGRIINVNDAFLKQLGFQQDEIVGTVLQESSFLTKDAQKQVMRRQIARLIGKETPSYTLDVKTGKGDLLSFDIETKLFSEDGKVAGEIGVVWKITNVSDKKQKKVEKQPKSRKIEPFAVTQNTIDNNFEVRKMQDELEKKQQWVRLHEQEIDELQRDLKHSQREIEQLRSDLEKRQKEIEKQHKGMLDKRWVNK